MIEIVIALYALIFTNEQNWVDQLRSNSNQVCCFNYDGRRLDDPDWDTLGKVNNELSGYRVFEDMTYHEIPYSALVTMKNQDGIARVWWDVRTNRDGTVTSKTVRCFLPGATG